MDGTSFNEEGSSELYIRVGEMRKSLEVATDAAPQEFGG
jgi:hypothetical protein